MEKISKEALDLTKKWFLLRRKLSSKNKLFLEIMTFAYIAINSKNSGIDIKKTTRKSWDNEGQIKEDIVYEMVVDIKGD